MQGVLSFCKAEAVLAGFLRSTKMDKEQLVERKFMQALQLFEQANQVCVCCVCVCTCLVVRACLCALCVLCSGAFIETGRYARTRSAGACARDSGGGVDIVLTMSESLSVFVFACLK